MTDSKKMGTVAGVDIGGTKIRWVRMRSGRVIDACEIRTPRNKTQVLSSLRNIFLTLEKRGARRVGIGFPGTIRGTRIISAHNMPFMKDTDIKRSAPKDTVLRMDNDARCFARAEAMRGAGRRTTSLLALILGTGIGRAYVRNGRILHLARFSHSERWEGAYQDRIASPPPALARFLAKELLDLVAETSPDAIVLGGGIMRKANFFNLLRRNLRKDGVKVPIRRSHFRQNAGAIGAALLFEK
jgi:predicted NBD/HSP70 family sugar kinase